MKNTRLLTYLFLFIIIFGAGIGLGIFIQNGRTSTLIVSNDSVKDFKLVEEAWNITRNKYVDTNATQPHPLAYGTIAGMVDSLGDTGHSTFLSPDEVKQINSFEQGQLTGIGIEIQEKNGSVVILAPLDGSPAQKAGLRSGDVILKVDGQSITTVRTRKS